MDGNIGQKIDKLLTPDAVFDLSSSAPIPGSIPLATKTDQIAHV
jgi:hypothetical protein